MAIAQQLLAVHTGLAAEKFIESFPGLGSAVLVVDQPADAAVAIDKGAIDDQVLDPPGHRVDTSQRPFAASLVMPV